MDNSITVRFVPHGRSNINFSDMESASSDALTNMISPTKTKMHKGKDTLSRRRMRAEETPLNRLNLTVSRSEFNDMFRSPSLKETKTSQRGGMIAQRETYLQSDVLEVPEALKGSIAFAYVPRPVEYFAPLAIPPKEHIYHLTLSDVQLALNAPRCHRNSLTGANIRVAMVDSGFWPHPHFIRSGFKLIPTESPGSGPADIDSSGHGTGEAANIFATAPECTVIGIKQGTSAASDLETAISQKPDVMTNSWGYDIDDVDRETLKQQDPNFFFELLDLEQIIGSAVDDNIVVLFSAGNGHLAFPASFPKVIAVGGVTLTEGGGLEASSYASAFTSKIYPGRNVPDICGIVGRLDLPNPLTAHIMLPVPPNANLDGENFPSNNVGSGWGIFSGTSAACPQAAGVVALLKQINRNLTPAQIRQILVSRSVDVTTGVTATSVSARTGPDLATGGGLIDALRACGYLNGMA